jgi:hypothetical protein
MKVRRETYSCTGRGFSKIDPDGYMARLLDFAIRPNVHGTTTAITSSTHAFEYFHLIGHGYVTGQQVALTLSGDGALPTGAEFTASTSLAYPFNRLNITPYYIIKISDDIFQLASSHYNALAGTPITFADDISGTSVHVTALGGGAQWYLHDDFSRMVALNFATTAVDTTAETITLVGNAFSHMHKVVFSSTGGVPGGLVAGTSYWLIYVSAGVYKVASTEALAYAGTGINLSSQGTGTHTITTAEHFVVLTDTLSPVVNDYNTSPAGCAPKFLKLGYVVSESGYVRMQSFLWWNSTTHKGQVCWSGVRLETYDSALFAYQFIGGDEFLFQASQLGATWYYQFIDTFTGITSKLEAITKVGVLQTGITAGSSVVLQLAAGQATNFTVNKFYYLYDFVGHDWVDYVKVTARDTWADTVTILSCSVNFPAGAVLTPYAHRYYMWGSGMGYPYGGSRMSNWTDYYIPYVSCTTQQNVTQKSADTTYNTRGSAFNLDAIISRGIPDDEGYYDCIRLLLYENGFADYYNAIVTMNRIYGKSNNILVTARGTMGQMVNTRTLLGVDYLYFGPAPTTYVFMITYTESAV